MNMIESISTIKIKFTDLGQSVKIPLLKDGYFNAQITEEGIIVDNLGNQPLLPWVVFQEAICVLIRNGGHAKRGNAMAYKLGEDRLSLDSLEGHIAFVVYNKQIGDTVFRRITPIACILIWAGICKVESHEIVLL
jgi:hypothetical protein